MAADPQLTGNTARKLGIVSVFSPSGRQPMDCDISPEDRTDQEYGVAWHFRQLDLAAEMRAVEYAGTLS